MGWGQAPEKTAQGRGCSSEGPGVEGGPECNWALRCLTEEGTLNLRFEG